MQRCGLRKVYSSASLARLHSEPPISALLSLFRVLQAPDTQSKLVVANQSDASTAGFVEYLAVYIEC
jgi:hypothetical protein